MRLVLTSLMCLVLFNAFSQSSRTEIMLLGSDHLRNVYEKGYPNTDVFSPQNQKDIQKFSSIIEKYSPDMIMVEAVPERQQEMDSLYSLYLENKLNPRNLGDGRDEIYQLAFRIGKNSGVPKIVCVNAEGGTSQSMLDNGDNIEVYENETKELRKVVKEKYDALKDGSISFKDFLIFLNQPEAYNMIYRLRYMIPARVTNGTFTNPDESVDTAFIDQKYIGAELISVFKKRDYKIYSNIVVNKFEKEPKRILVIIGVAHIGSLKSIFRDDKGFTVVDANRFLLKDTREQNEK